MLEDDEDFEDGLQNGVTNGEARHLQPPKPISQQKNWPLLEVKANKGVKGELLDYLGDKA